MEVKTPKTMRDKIEIFRSIHQSLAEIGFLSIKITGMNLTIYGTAPQVRKMEDELLQYAADLSDCYMIYGFIVRIKEYDQTDWKMKFEACSGILERLRKSFLAYIAFRLKI